jgi:hypothetical protein
MGRHRCRWEDKIKMELQEVGEGCWDWSEMTQVRDSWRALVSTVMNLRVSKMRGISRLAAEAVSFSRRAWLHGVSKKVVNYSPYGSKVVPFGRRDMTKLIVAFRIFEHA